MVRPTMFYLFLTFGIWGLCKMVTNLFQIRQVLLCRLSQVIGYSPTTIPRQRILPQKRYAFKENGSCKKVSGRTVQLDEITSIFVIRSKERNLGSDSRVFQLRLMWKPLHEMYGLRSNLQLNNVGKARANLSGAQTSYC